jgi:hypothetical protein
LLLIPSHKEYYWALKEFVQCMFKHTHLVMCFKLLIERKLKVIMKFLFLTLCRSYLNPTARAERLRFYRGHVNLHTTPETGLPCRIKNSKKLN